MSKLGWTQQSSGLPALPRSLKTGANLRWGFFNELGAGRPQDCATAREKAKVGHDTHTDELDAVSPVLR